jgi:hypothetical protein
LLLRAGTHFSAATVFLKFSTPEEVSNDEEASYRSSGGRAGGRDGGGGAELVGPVIHDHDHEPVEPVDHDHEPVEPVDHDHEPVGPVDHDHEPVEPVVHDHWHVGHDVGRPKHVEPDRDDGDGKRG